MWYEEKDVKPMLIGIEKAPFDDPNYVYEIKMDGVRCMAYIASDHVELINKRDLKLNAKFPELNEIHKQVKAPCILDGELHIFHEGRSDFFEVQKRTLTSDPFKIRLHASQFPASFTAFDILYYRKKWLLDTPLIKRKKILDGLIQENDRIHISRYIEETGVELFQLTQDHHLEGIVAKRKDSHYYFNKRTKDWIKCKNLLDDDFVITGYISKEKGFVSLILAQYDGRILIYKGHVTMGVSLPYLHANCKKTDQCPFAVLPSGNEEAVWIQPFLVGTVKFMEYTHTGGLRQPVFKGFRDDKDPADCVVPLK